MSSFSKTHKPQIHGHRGCRGLFPENTLPAFLRALELGVDVLEMDVVLSADQQVVVAHEPWLSAKLGLSPEGHAIDPACEQEAYNIYALPYATIRRSIVGTLPHPRFPAQQQVATYRPLLGEVLETAEAFCRQAGRPPVGFSIEVKSSPDTEGKFHPAPHEFTATVLAAIPSTLLPRITLLSFDPRVLQAARQLLPALRVCLLVETIFTPAHVFASLGFVPDVFGPDYTLLNEELVAELLSLYKMLEVVPWTINEPSELTRFAKTAVTGITTDFPDVALQVV